MKKLSKAILLGLGALLVLVVFGLFCVNLYIQSPRTQEQIQAQLSKTLRMPLKITNTTLSPWSGLRISGITIPHGDGNFLEAGTFSASYRVLPLLAGKLTIPEMSVDRPKVVWRQNAEGKWKLPALERAAATAPEENKTPEVKPPAEQKPKSGFSVVIGRFLVKSGAVDLVDKDGKHTAVFSDVNMTYTTLTPERVEGTAVIGRIVWADSLVLENVRTPFTYAAGEFTLPEITATLGGGPVRGSYRAQPDAPKAPFAAAVTFEQVSMDRLATGAGWKSGQAAGTLAGKLDVKGDLNRSERAEGPGQLQLRDAQFQKLELFQSIGQALGVDLRFKEGRADFHLGGEKVNVDQLVLSAADSRLESKGYIRFDKKVALDTRLGLTDESMKRLPDMIRNSFTVADSGQKTIDFNITGSTDKLRTNLLDKLIGQKINQQFDDFLTGIFGGSKKEDEKKKQAEEERKKAEKKKKEQEKAAAKAAKAAATAPPVAAPPLPPAPAAPTTTITPVKP